MHGNHVELRRGILDQVNLHVTYRTPACAELRSTSERAMESDESLASCVVTHVGHRDMQQRCCSLESDESLASCVSTHVDHQSMQHRRFDVVVG